MYLASLYKLQKALLPSQAILISQSENLFYLLKIKTLVSSERESFLVITHKKFYLLHSSFSSPLKLKDLENYSGIYGEKLIQNLKQINKKTKLKTLFVNYNDLKISEYDLLKKAFVKTKLENFEKKLLWQLRSFKSPKEIKKMALAGQIAQKAIIYAKTQLKPGLTEIKLKNIIIKKFYELEAEGEAFPTIVAFGKNTALAHHQPGKTKLKINMPVMIDLGAKVGNYCSDTTRTIWFGKKPSQKFLEIEKIILAAFKAAESKLASEHSPAAKNIDLAARSIINKAGFGDKFIHTSGHGLGLEIHEPPSLNYKNETKIKPGMAVTIEPGIYLPKQFGYRHEDTFVKTKTGIINLTE